jgi:hypothetical protein
MSHTEVSIVKIDAALQNTDWFVSEVILWFVYL